MMQDVYSNGHLSNYGTNRSSGGPVIGYGVTPSTTTTDTFLSATGIAVPRTALVMDGSFRWFTGDDQTVSIGGAATMSQKMVLTNAGRLGIGTPNPSTELEVLGSTTLYGNAGTLKVKGTNHVYIELYPSGTTREAYIGFASVGTKDVQFTNENTGGHISLIPGSGGNVGIGTASPVSKLDVNGSINILSSNNLTWGGAYGANIPTIVGVSGVGSFIAVYPAGSTSGEKVRIDANGNVSATAFSTGNYISYGFSIPPPTAAFGNGRSYIRIQTTASGARISSFKIRLSTTWNYVPGFGYIEADVSYYFDGTSLVYPNVNVTSATNQALNSIAVGDLVIESGYISIPVYITDTNTLLIKIEGSSSFDYTLVSTTGWSSFTFPGSNTVTVPGKFYVGGNTGIGVAVAATRLHVAGSTQSTGASTIPALGYSNTSSVALFTNADTVYGTLFGVLSDGKGWIQQQRVDTIATAYDLILQPNGGNVGIGYQSPQARLHISSINGSSGTLFQKWDYAGNPGVYELQLKQTVTDGVVRYNFSMINASTAYNDVIVLDRGKVGMGTTDPSQKLDVQGDGVRLRLSTSSSPSTYYFDIQSNYDSADTINFYGTAGNNLLKYIYNTNKLSLQPAGGFVGIGTTTPYEKLEVAGAISASGGWNSDSNQGAATTMGFQAGYGFVQAVDWGVAYQPLILNPSGGDVGIGDTTPSYKLDVDGTIRATGDVIAYSDARVKENVQTVENALSKVISLRGVTYNRNDIEDKSRKIGVIAQEVLEVLPEVVQRDNEGKYSVSYGNIVGLLIEAIKEQQNEIKKLKDRL
jgi:hypothetical protein